MKRTPVKKERTRKQKAIRRTLIFLGMVVFVSVTHLYSFFPFQARYINEEMYYTDRTHLVQRLYEPSLNATKLALFDLTANEHATMLHCVRWHPLIGWEACFASVLDCGTLAPLYGGQYTVSHHGEDGKLFFVFGRVDDSNIASVKISLQYRTYLPEEQRELWTEELSRTSDSRNWKEQDGHRYFVENFGLLHWNHEYRQKVILTAYDINGQEVTMLDVSEQGCSTSLG